MIILQLLPILCLLLFILLQSVSIKIKTKDRLTVKINFNILAITLTEDEIKKKHLGHIKKVIKNVPIIYKALRYLISKSVVIVMGYPQNALLYAEEDIFKSIRRYAIYQIAYSYLATNSRSFHFAENQVYSYDNTEEKSSDFDVLFHFSLFHLINSALLFLYYIVKNKAKRVINHV
jgi:hypothetical protein